MRREPGKMTAPGGAQTQGPIVLFDGECGFCSRLVLFVVPRDPAGHFRFAPLQSQTGQRILARAGMPREELDTLVVVEGERILTRSDAALRIAAGLTGFWRALRFARIVPRAVRDRAYDLVARNRYRLRSARARCILPSDLEGRMIEFHDPGRGDPPLPE
jgi:predicted DCC family thiol-disulfide oxidoreductase YuxK